MAVLLRDSPKVNEVLFMEGREGWPMEPMVVSTAAEHPGLKLVFDGRA